LNLLNKHPGWKRHLRLLAINAQIITDASMITQFPEGRSDTLHSMDLPMSPRSLNLYIQLKSAVEERGN
jgi:hypothetical protein